MSFAQSSTIGAELKHEAVRNRALITVPSGRTTDGASRSISIQFPSGTRPETVKAFLNGKDVATRFTQQDCKDYVCLSATLTAADGMVNGENIVFATAKNNDGTASSSRLHFGGASAAIAAVARPMISGGTKVPSLNSGTLPTLSTFLPPTVGFYTIVNGGTTPGSGGVQPGAPWLQLGSQIQISAPTCSGSGIYGYVDLDRHTLAQNSSACEVSGAALATDLGNLTPGDLVIAGTFYGQQTDSGGGPGQLDTTAIGGRAYNCSSSNAGGTCGNSGSVITPDTPQGYLTIGVVGAKSGSAYESYYLPNDNTDMHWPMAMGMLVSDVNGNFNFQSTGNVEYIAQAGADAAHTQVTVMNAPSGPGINVVYQPNPGSQNGFWLLVLDRTTLGSVPGCTQKGGIWNGNCGTFFPTGPTNPIPGDPNLIQNLATALSQVDDTQLAILTTVGTAGWGNPSYMASDNSSPNNTLPLALVLQSLGIPDKSILQTGTPPVGYTFITSPGLGGPLTGHSVLSNAGYINHGHTGYLHGTFARDQFGRFEPAHTEQQAADSDNANLKLGLYLAQAPVDWPELSQTTTIAGADSVAGQLAAYQYLSWYLLNGWYIPGQMTSNGRQEGVTAPYAYDIHYFYTGSLNTSVSIQTFDPANAVYPGIPGFSDPRSYACTGGAGSTCTWTNPVDSTTLTFTQNDFNAVKVQMHNEIVDLTNVLGYLVTGSTNLKDVVAAGNSNAALTLIQASSQIQANVLQPPPSTPVTVSPWHIVHMIASDLSPVVSLATDGIVNAADVAQADKAIGIIGDLFAASGSTSGGLASGQGSQQGKDIARLDYRLDTTLGQLAGTDIQGQILAGFDTTIDTITSDWGRLSALGAGAVDSQVLFSPTQVTQNQAIGMITKASQKSLYLSLIPQFYQVQEWPMAGKWTPIDLGYTSNGDSDSCKPIYQNVNNLLTSVSYPTYGGTKYIQSWQPSSQGTPYRWDTVSPWLDWYVLATPYPANVTAYSPKPVMDQNVSLTLFGAASGDLNFSLDEFVAVGGPMDSPLTGAASSLVNAAFWSSSNGKNFAGVSTEDVCSTNDINGPSYNGTPVTSTYATTTTLQAPQSAVLGADLVLGATVVKKISAGVPTGSIQFLDGTTVLQTVALDATGNATYNAKGLAVGTHSLSADFIPAAKDQQSESSAQDIAIYAEKPDMELSLSQAMISVTYGTTSLPVTLQVKALSGMTGTVSYQCTGLPSGMSCSFAPANGTFTDGVAKTAFTISGSAIEAASFGPLTRWGAMLLVIPFGLALSIRHKAKKLLLGVFPLLALGIFAASIAGCSGGSNPPSTFKDVGQKTILVSASAGNLTRTTPLTINVQ